MNRNIAAFTCVMESQPEDVSADGVGNVAVMAEREVM